MNLKNYTSGVPVSRTIARIEEVLAEAGASGISKNYRNGKLDSMTFQIELGNGKEVNIRLPSNTGAVAESMKKKVRRPHQGTLERIQQQAERTAWKLLQDWIEVQVSLIAMHHVDVLQVFLPYVWNGQSTFYETLKDSGFKQLQITNGAPA